MRWPIFFMASLAARCLGIPTTSAAADLSMDGPSGKSVQQSASGSATWLWESEMIANPEDVSKFLSFAKAHNLGQVFAQVNPDIPNASWESFISQCSASGITVDALIGNPQWVLSSGTPTLESQLDWIEGYQRASGQTSGFAGIHMDVEPWGLADWESNKAVHIAGWESVAKRIASFARSLGMTVAADLPFWANTLDSTTPAQKIDIWMLNLLDSAVFMTYRNTVAGVESLASPVLAAGDAIGKPVWLSVETTFEDDQLSYWGKGVSKLEADLAVIAKSSSEFASFGGIAVHDYNGWSAMT
ncbi:hypothetical protein HJFPF1_05925 [Paramyrothecium foliicola]|nr:hypothetical protein HJFPF1_05925 [Paramyrothecium foliicola]